MPARRERHAVVSCHVESPLDDRSWRLFEQLQERRPGGLTVAALMRPPDPETGEDEEVWLQRAAAAAARAPLGHHTHWTSPTHARPTSGDPAARVRREAAWLRERGIEATLFCGGGWYMDEPVAEALAELGYVDCTATPSRPAYLAPDAPRLAASVPVWLRLPSGRRLLELPSTHSLGAALRAALRPSAPAAQLIHVHFHDFDLLDRRRRAALLVALEVLGRRARPTDLDELARRVGAEAGERPFAPGGVSARAS